MSLKRGIFYTFLTQGPTLVLYFVASTLMTRILGDEGRGAFALLQNQVTLVAMVLGFGMSMGTTYFTARDQGDPTRMVRVCTSLLLVNMVVVPLFFLLVFTVPALRKVFLPEQAVHWGYWLYLLLNVLFSQTSSFIGSIMLGLKKFKIINRMSIFTAAGGAVGFTTLYLFRDTLHPGAVLPSVLAITLGYTALTAITWATIYARVVGIMPKPTWSWAVLRPVLAFVLIGYTGNLINLINYRFDVWVVGSYAGTAQLGLYAVAVGIGQLFLYIPEPFANVIQPYLYGEMSSQLLSKFKFIMRLNFTTVMLLALMAGLFAPWFMPMLFGEVFQGSVTALWWLLPGIALVACSKLLGPLIVQGGYIRFNLYAVAASAVVTVVLDFILVPSFGIQGAALASSLAYLTNVTIQCLVVRFKLGIPIWDMFLLRPSDIGRVRQLITDRLRPGPSA
ncbi:MAG TPA: oligosaccharide flippase family protein [Flavobacteriales bacterium]|nr:oligosaccharide flippase family protein [Flavobacteriales bacterium]